MKNDYLFVNLLKHTTPIIIALLGFALNGHSQSWAQAQKIVNGDRAVGDQFGYSVAISGDQAVVGAWQEDEDANGINTIAGTGSAYLFSKVNGVWIQDAKLVANDRTATDYFGWSVDISGDQVIIGAFADAHGLASNSAITLSGAGSAYIFEKVNGVWTQQAKLIASDRGSVDVFGYSVAIDGDHAIVGAFLEDEDVNGANTLAASGSAYIFAKINGVWTEEAKIVANSRAIDDCFGISVDISGDQAIVGAFREDDDANDANALYDPGSAYIFAKVNGIWSQQAKLVSSDRDHLDNFGHSVAISGDKVVVGAFMEDEEFNGSNTLSNTGSAYVFSKVNGVWTEEVKLVARDREIGDQFGYSVDISGDKVIVGAYLEDEDLDGKNTFGNAGSAYVFGLVNGTWMQLSKLIADDRGLNDQFGLSVAISGDDVIVGAFQDDENVDDINTLADAGSAYFFESAPLPACQVTNSFSFMKLNKAMANAGADQIHTYYLGISRGFISTYPTGGIGPYTYNWTSSAGYTILSNTSNRIQLWYPTGPQWLKVEITDQGSGCTIEDSVFIDFVDYTCNKPNYWFYEMCNNFTNTTTCVAGPELMRAYVDSGNWSFGSCSSQSAKTESVAAAKDAFGVNVFPNPSNGEFTYIVNSKAGKTYTSEVLDVNGRVLFTESFKSNDTMTSREISLNDLAKGIYFIKVSGNSSSTVERISIQ